MRWASGLLLGCVAVGCAPSAEDGPVPVVVEHVDADSAWRVHRAEQGLDDHAAEVMLTRLALPAGNPDGPRPRLILGCLDEVTSAYVVWPDDLAADTVRVAYRLGDGPQQQAQWLVSSDGSAAGLWTDSTSVPFIRSLLAAETLMVQVETSEGESLEAAFTLDGLEEPTQELAALCQWP